ncbi:TadE/TadG family type IV pilus assembly protein [Catellatospora paridis]|uniref:TadE/TadG family type IV pilus assembly protein n=1 Tax=Catellatospora paridis TaxID=1617086 RepID=UPI0012D3B1AB|nr:TadE/TadG family type IV pilus assembly protein [Catellatospora paridis]
MTTRRQLAADRGAVSTEFALAAPILVLLLIALIYGFAWANASYAARSAAQQAVNSARVVNGDPATAQATATQTMRERSGTAQVQVVVDRGQQTTTATVTTTISTPFGSLPVSFTAVAPTERWSP